MAVVWLESSKLSIALPSLFIAGSLKKRQIAKTKLCSPT